MKLLAIETATIEVGVAIAADDDGLLAEARVRPGRRHAETLHPLIAETAARARLSLGALDAVAVDVGPGLFTGLRVGMAAAKSLAFALGLKLVAARSTEVLAHALSWYPGPVAAAVDLRRGELAWSLSTEADPFPVRGRPEDLAEALAALGQPALLAGDGARRYHAELAALLGQAGAPAPTIAGDELAAPPPAALAALGLAKLAAGEHVDPFGVEPCYLREAEVRIGWSTRHDDVAATAPDPARDGGEPARGGREPDAARGGVAAGRR